MGLLLQQSKTLERALKEITKQTDLLKEIEVRSKALTKLNKDWADATLKITGPTKKTIEVLAQIQENMFPRDLKIAVAQIQEATKNTNAASLVVSSYFSKSMRELLDAYKISYADTVGNFKMQFPDINVYIQGRGEEDKNPYRMPDRPRKSLRGAPAIKVLQELIRTKPPVSLPQITKLSGSSTGVVYRLLEFLESEALIIKNKTLVNNREVEKVTEIDWQGILQAWARDYKVLKDNKVTMALDPRGLQNTIKKLEKLNPKTYAVTGTVAANQFRNYGSPSQVMIYAANSQKLIEELELSEIENGSNVILLETKAPFIFERSQVLQEGFSTAPIAQIAVDLLSGPGRSPEVGNELIKWMSENSKAWMRND